MGGMQRGGYAARETLRSDRTLLGVCVGGCRKKIYNRSMCVQLLVLFLFLFRWARRAMNGRAWAGNCSRHPSSALASGVLADGRRAGPRDRHGHGPGGKGGLDGCHV